MVSTSVFFSKGISVFCIIFFLFFFRINYYAPFHFLLSFPVMWIRISLMWIRILDRSWENRENTEFLKPSFIMLCMKFSFHCVNQKWNCYPDPDPNHWSGSVRPKWYGSDRIHIICLYSLYFKRIYSSQPSRLMGQNLK